MDYLNNISSKTMYNILSKIHNEDIYEKHFERSIKQLAVFELLLAYSLIFVASDSRVMLTKSGQDALEILQTAVELSKK